MTIFQHQVLSRLARVAIELRSTGDQLGADAVLAGRSALLAQWTAREWTTEVRSWIGPMMRGGDRYRGHV